MPESPETPESSPSSPSSPSSSASSASSETSPDAETTPGPAADSPAESAAGAEAETAAEPKAEPAARSAAEAEPVADPETEAEAEAESGDEDYEDDEDGSVEAAILRAAARATLPFQAARQDRSFGTAFWYNDLVSTNANHEVIRQYLVTAESRTRYEIGQFTLRDGLAEPELPADELVLPSFAKKWTGLGGLGVAVMPTTDLHIHAERKGWSWSTDEVTSGLAAQPDDIALIGTEPLPAYVLGHEVDEEPGGRHADRPQVLLPGMVSRQDAEPVRWTGPFPQGLAGAPVFTVLPMEDGRAKLVCLGLALPGDPAADASTAAAAPTVVTFDLLRPAIHAVTPRHKRRWWQRG